MDKKDKIAGSIIGLIIGDLLAFPLKFINYSNRQQYFPVENIVEPFNVDKEIEEANFRNNDLKNKIYTWYPAGYYSFYSQQALLVYDSVYQFQDIDIEDISQKLVKYSFPRDRTAPLGIFRGYNRQFYDSVQNISNGLPLKVCGVTNNVGDSAIKAVPIGLFFGTETKSIRDKTLDVTLLTNRDVSSIASASAIGYIMSQTLTRSFFNADEELGRVIDFVRQTEDYALKRYGDFLSESEHHRNMLPNALNELYRLRNEPTETGVKFYKDFASQHNLRYNSPTVTTALSLLLFIKNIGSFEHLIKNTLALDIEIEIIAPIVGALSGSLLGVEKIPQQWKERVRGMKDICLRAENFNGSTEKPKLKNYYLRELELSNEQYKCKEIALKKLDEKQTLSLAEG